MSVKIVKSQRGHNIYEINGYLYHKNVQKVNPKNGEKTVYLKCSKSRNNGCRNTRAVLVVKADSIHVKYCSPAENHNHPAPSEDILALNIKSRLKLRVAENPTKSPKEVYKEVINEEVSLNENCREEFITAIPTFHSMRMLLTRHKRKCRPELPTDLENFCLEGQCTTINNENFVLFETDDPDKIIAFATTQFLSILCTEPATKTIYMDGTFGATPKLFDQLCTIHAFYRKQMFPFVYVLLPNRTEDTYVRMFELLQEAARKLDLHFQPDVVISDFEVAAINAVRKCFPAIVIKGSQYHFSQAVWRKFKQLKLSTFESDETVKKMLQRSAALPLCKLEDINEAWITIVLDSVGEGHRAYRNSDRFRRYMVDTWLDGLNAFSQTMWNNYNNFCVRTNSHLEEWHKKLHKVCKKKKSNIYDLIGVIKSQHLLSKSQLDSEGEPQQLSVEFKQLNTAIRNATNDYDNDDCTLIDFLTIVGSLLPLHDFNARVSVSATATM